MRLIYFLDYRFVRTCDGAVWTDTSYESEFWEPYLRTFDHITLVSRTRQVDAPAEGWHRVDGPRVSVCCLPDYGGYVQYLRKRRQVKAIIHTVLAEPGAVILRAPSQLASYAFQELTRLRRPYAVENVGDAGAALARGATRVRGRSLLQWYFARAQQRQCANAMAASYVAGILKQRYPCAPGAPALVCSDVRLDEQWIRHRPRIFRYRAHHLLTVATLSQTYKGIDVLLEAMARCWQAGLPLTLTIVGEGRLKGALEAQARALGIADNVVFRGPIAWGPELVAEFDRADLFVLPSRVEAMPRALIEAMARALPCIGTDVGAVAELLDYRSIARPNDAVDLSQAILRLACHPHVLTNASARNLEVAHEFTTQCLRPQWLKFYRQIAQLTAAATQPCDPNNSNLRQFPALFQESNPLCEKPSASPKSF